jgi:hypothetical protein
MAVGRTPLRAIIEKSSSRSSAAVTPSGTYGALALSVPTFTEESLAWRYGGTSFAIVTASRKLSIPACHPEHDALCGARGGIKGSLMFSSVKQTPSDVQMVRKAKYGRMPHSWVLVHIAGYEQSAGQT